MMWFVCLLFHWHATITLIVGTPVYKECPLGWFICEDNSTCIKQQHNCDGHFDCPSGSDEGDCGEEHEYDFYDQLLVKRPDEDSEKIIEPCNLAWDGENCRCANTTLFCPHQSLHRVPKDLPSGMHKIDLSGNLITEIFPEDFASSHELREIQLLTGWINTIHPEAFGNLSKLEALYLTDNRIVTLENSSLVGLSSLKILKLDYNILSEIQKDAFTTTSSLEELNLSNNQLTLIYDDLFSSTKLRTLYLNENQITTLHASSFRGLTNLRTLYLSNNRISVLEPHTFKYLSSLERLFMDGNLLEVLVDNTFYGLHKLLILKLNSNRNLKDLEDDAFADLIKVESLNLKDTPSLSRSPSVKAFQSMKSLDYVYFTWFSQCSAAPHVRVCDPKTDGVSSVEHLLDNYILRVSVWVVAGLACCGNIGVIIGRLIVRVKQNDVHSYFISNLAFADLLMGIYLIIIASYDVTYRGKFIHYDRKWRSSWQCHFSGFLSFLSSVSSILILTVITYDRFLSVTYPLKRRENMDSRYKMAAMVMVVTWTLAVSIAAMPLLPFEYFGNNFYGNNGVCLPLHVHDPYAQAWQYTTFIFIGLTTFSLLLIVIAYQKMLTIIMKSKISLRSTQEKQDSAMARRFLFIVGTDCVCWLPIITLKSMALMNFDIKEGLYRWVAVFILPVNAALNPILYTLTAAVFTIKFRVYFNGVRYGGCCGDMDDDKLPTPSQSLGGSAKIRKDTLSSEPKILQ